MEFSTMLPFLAYAAIKRRRLEEIDLNDSKYIRSSVIEELPDNKLDEMWSSYGDYDFPIIHLLPNDIYFYYGNDVILEVLLNSKYSNRYVNAIVTEVDYQEVANRIEFFNNNTTAGYNFGNNLYEFANIATTQFIEDAVNGLKSNSEQLRDLLNRTILDHLGESMISDISNLKLYSKKNSIVSVNLPPSLWREI